MSVSEAEKEIDDWMNNGRQMRIDGLHQGNDEVHAPLYLDDNPYVDLLIQIEPDPETESYGDNDG